MTKADFIKKCEDFAQEISSDADCLEDVGSFQDCLEIATFTHDTKQRIQQLKEILT